MRTFLAIAPDAETALDISRWCELCWPAHARKIPVQNYHLTLAFLGDTDDRALQTLAEIMDAFNHAAFDLRLETIGYWPDTDVLWLGPSQIPQALHTLHKKCRHAANRIGARGSSKRYQPHLTLARKFIAPPGPALIEPDFSFKVRELQLWSTVRESHGASYHTLATWPLD